MNDLVLLGFVENFANDRGLEIKDTSRVFEVFAASSILRKFHQFESADVENDVLVGGGGDGGLDAISVLVNGRPVRSSEDVDFFIEKLGSLEVEFVFIQTKSSAHFSSSDIGQFLYGVEQFFSKEPKINFNNEVENIRKVTDYIYRSSIHMDQNPNCFLYYVTSGSWQGAPDLEGRFEAGRLTLENTKLFENISVIPIDANLLKSTYRELERRVVKNVEFSKTAVFPKVNGVDEAYIGLLSGDQFIDLVSRDDGELNRELFYDNVRDFQGDNPVNKEIDQTLSSAHHRNSFPLLNNGITIVARSINRTGDTFRISDFQIVNGCQTTHMLYLNKHNVDSTLFIPIKLVATGNSQVVADVIKATNRQTAVLPEALESLTPFHKELESFYSYHHFPNEKIYYERRSKQYALDNVKTGNIISLTAQTKSFLITTQAKRNLSSRSGIGGVRSAT